MENLNPLNACLYSVTGASPMPVERQGHKIEVELFDSTAKVEHIWAYSFHPDKLTGSKRLINWCVERFSGKTAVLVRLDGAPSAMYVRVNELSRVLNLSSQEIRQRFQDNNTMNFLGEHQLKQTVEKIRILAEQEGMIWTLASQKSIEDLIKEVGYQKVVKAVEEAQLDGSQFF